LKPLYTPINDISSRCNAPLLPPAEMAQVLVHAVAWAKDLNLPIYVFQLLTGDRAGYWTCGAYPPALRERASSSLRSADVCLRVEPDGGIYAEYIE
jgi:hypothetical protein